MITNKKANIFAGNIFSILIITTLALVFECSDAKVIVDYSADKGVETNENKVTIWHDQSGNGFDALPGLQYGPTLTTVAINNRSHPVLHFNEDNFLISIPHVPRAGTLFLVFNNAATTGDVRRVIGWDGDGVNGIGIIPNYIYSGKFNLIARDSDISGDIESSPSNGMEVTAVSWGANGVTLERIFSNGKSISSVNQKILSVSDGGYSLHIGGSGNYPSSFEGFQGDIAALRIYDEQLSQTERLAYSNHLYNYWISGVDKNIISTTSRLSLTNSGRQTKGDSYTSSVSNDGRYVAFASDATNLVSGDTNGATDIFLLDRVTKQVKLVSKAATPANGDSLRPVISGNGRYIAYESYASNLVSSDTNDAADIFRYDRIARTTTRISVASGGTEANSDSSQASIADDGNRIAFASNATNLVTGDANAASDVFVRDVTAKTTTRASVGATESNGDSLTPSLSGNGGFVAFVSAATNLVADDSNGRYDIFVRDLAAASTARVSVRNGVTAAQANNDSWQPHISQDGRYVVFASDATNLYSRTGGGSNGATDIYLRDRVSNVTGWVSRTAAGGQSNEASYNPHVTADGRYVVFESYANLVTEDTNGVADIYLRDRKAVKTILLSASTAGIVGNSESLAAALTVDGRYAVFESYATNLVAGDTNLAWDIFVRDRGVGVTPSYPRSLRNTVTTGK